MEKEYSETYFSSAGRFERAHGYLKLFPAPLVEWYFNNHQKRLEHALRNYKHFVPSPAGLKILEIGTGNGGFMAYCGKENAIGIDVWKEGVKKLAAQGFDVRYHDASKPFPFPDGSFDVVYSEQVIEHIHDGVAFAAEMNRVLRKGGKAVVRTVDIARAGMWFYTDYTHVHPYTKSSLYRLMEDSGFEVAEIAHGISPNSFVLRRLANIAIMLPAPVLEAYLDKVCRKFSYEIYAVGMKK